MTKVCTPALWSAFSIDKNERIIAGRRANALRWRERLARVGFSSVRLPPDQNNVFMKFWVIFDGTDADREMPLLRSSLWRYGGENERIYTPLHLWPAFERYRRADLRETERLWNRLLALPVRPDLGTANWSRIDAALDRAAKQLKRGERTRR
jgi:dTDP-4-amino-4,6-dideoxygalactose transaminase